MHKPTQCWACDRPLKDESTPSFELTDDQWSVIEDLFGTPPRKTAVGRPRADSRRCFEGVLWVLRTGARWRDLPKCFPSPTTCWRRFQEWSANGVWAAAWQRLLMLLDEHGKIDRQHSIADGTFSSAKKGDVLLARPGGAKAQRSCSLRTPTGFHWERPSRQLISLK